MPKYKAGDILKTDIGMGFILEVIGEREKYKIFWYYSAPYRRIGGDHMILRDADSKLYDNGRYELL